jgi:nicotinamide-nucleotide adenylyltransferase
MAIGLFIGRFQPFHNGHLHVVKQMVSECSEIIIGIGSANCERSAKNPFITSEREEMIEQVLNEAGIENYNIVSIEDQETHKDWVKEVKDKASPFDVVYVSGDNIRLDFIKACGFNVKIVDFVDGISATKVRELIKNNEPWEQLVPPAVANYAPSKPILS